VVGGERWVRLNGVSEGVGEAREEGEGGMGGEQNRVG